ncbi:protein mono-ADP-ribosyltransferase PARP14-like [Protopterus annectens]|uniref:protein mono-ADP-ribosyltransferase PARP14-like n=1 Tax=Protopterus annectens TaxID=7888 RepID=UPI001CFB0702|nr:protein mono-ADP-ribosyltransferase PARP14-like [Protopterus annectens]
MATVLVTGLSKYSAKAFQTKLVAYFQSKKKSGGGECSLSLLGNGDALLAFKQEEDLKNVLSRTHTVTIEGKDIPITVSRYEEEEEENVDKKPVQKKSASKKEVVQMPSLKPQEKPGRSDEYDLDEDSQVISDVEAKTDSVDPSRILIEIVNENFDRENLELLIECCSDADAFKIHETDSDGKVIVEFSSTVDVAAIVQKIRKKQKKKNVEVQMLKKPQSIKLIQLSTKINKDHLELYFESKIKGDDPVDVEINEKDQSAVITFPHPEDVLRVMSVSHTIKGEDLKIHLYFDEVQLMTFTSEEEKEEVHVLQMKLRETDKEPSSNKITDACLLKNEHCLQILKQHNIESEHPEVQLNFDTDVESKIEITGLPSDVNAVQLKLLRIASQIESKIWHTTLYCHEFLTKVEKEDFVRNIFLKSGINATYSCSKNQIKLYAVSEEHLLKAEKTLNAVLFNTEVTIPKDFFTQNIVKDLNRFLAEIKNSLLLKNSEYNIIQGEKLLHHFISPSDEGRVDKVALAGYIDITTEAKKMLADYLEKHCMTKIVFPLESAGVSECLRRFVDLQSMFPNAKIEFEEEEDLFSLHVDVNSLTASETKKILTAVIGQVVYHKEELKKPGAVQFIEKNRPLLKSLETTYQCVIHTEGGDDKTAGSPVDQNEEFLTKFFLHKKFKISVIKHNVFHQDTDAVLLPVEEPLEISKRLLKMMTDAGGPQFQDIVKEWKQKEDIKIGSLHIIPGGQLTFKCIIFVIIPKWKDAGVKEEILKASLLRALNTAENKGIKSIAVHPFDFEKSMSSLHQCSRILMMSVKEFCDAHTETYVNLTDIRLVSSDDKCLSEMKAAQHHFKDPTNETSDSTILLKLAKQPTKKSDSLKSFQQTELDSQQQQRKAASESQSGKQLNIAYGNQICNYVTPEGITISLIKGNIGLQKSDVIVNTVSAALNLTYGAVSKAILDQAGYKLQENTNQVKPATEVLHGAVVPVSTAGCDIACKEVYNTVCCQFNSKNPAESEKTLQDIIKKCLENAHNSGYQSITFPAIGTGNLRYPKRMVAETFIKEVTEFGRANTTTLTTVNVVVYEKDKDTLKNAS